MIHYIIYKLKSLRDLWYKHVIWRKYKIGRNFHCARGVFLWANQELSIGNDFYIGKYSIIETNCRIGNGVLIANNVGIVGRYDHNYQEIGNPIRLASSIRQEIYDWKGKKQITVIGDDVWIGYGSIILSGVNIADGCIIAAGSVLTKDTEPYSIYAGNPAKKIHDRFDNQSDMLEHIKKIKTRY